MLRKQQNITIIFLLLFFLLLVLDHFHSINHQDLQIKIQEHGEHQEGSSPCGM